MKPSEMLYDARHAYLEWCRHNDVVNVYARINTAINDGEAAMEYTGYLPPDVINDIEAMGYAIDVVDCTTFGARTRKHYIIQWGT